jgi:predicted secreted Zn-dependent protease
VTVQIVTTLPRWTDLPTASDRLISDWALFLARLRDHESRHQHLALEGSRELLASLSGLEAPSCALLHARAEGMASSLAARYDAEHVRVDESSDQDLRRIP